MPDADPSAKSISFPAVYDGVHVIVTATAYEDQIDLYPVPSKRLEIPLEIWRTMAPFLTAAAHTRRDRRS